MTPLPDRFSDILSRRRGAQFPELARTHLASGSRPDPIARVQDGVKQVGELVRLDYPPVAMVGACGIPCDSRASARVPAMLGHGSKSIPTERRRISRLTTPALDQLRLRPRRSASDAPDTPWQCRRARSAFGRRRQSAGVIEGCRTLVPRFVCRVEAQDRAAVIRMTWSLNLERTCEARST